MDNVDNFFKGDKIMEIKKGKYRHFKGKEYEVLEIAYHSETLEEMVVYRAEYGDKGVWVRPKTMFLESVEVNGQIVERFAYKGKNN